MSEDLNFFDVNDLALRSELEDALVPKGTGRVAKSPNFQFIVCHLLRGTPPLEIQQLVEREKGEIVQATSIRDYGLCHIPHKLLRTHSVYRQVQAEPAIDEVQALETLLKIQMKRVMARIDRPLATADEEQSIRREIDLAHNLAKSSLEAKIKTGRIAEAPKDVNLNMIGPAVQVMNNSLNVSSSAATASPVLSVGTRTASTVLRALDRIAALQAVIEAKPDDEKDSGESLN